jgi:MFS transporter, FHS family, glucose/mannose:H+ symporter
VSATNLIFGTEHPERRGTLLAWVNFCWGAGAVLAPEAVAVAERADAVRPVLVLLAACAFFAFVALTPLLRRPSGNGAKQASPEAELHGARMGLRVFVLFSAMLFLYLGAETSVAGWIATYAHRLSGLSVERASLFVSAFWLSVVAGRVLAVLMLRMLPEQVVLLGGLVTAMAGVTALLFPHAPWTAFAAVVVAGLGCAPVFPLSVSRMLARTGRSRHTGMVFAICSLGGAVVPWVTGVISQYSGGLRPAFLAPLVALAGVLVCVLIESMMARPESVLVLN